MNMIAIQPINLPLEERLTNDFLMGNYNKSFLKSKNILKNKKNKQSFKYGKKKRHNKIKEL